MREEAPILTIDENGDKYWRNKEGELHRIDGPAAEYSDGRKEWHKNGKLHRIDGPAIECSDGRKEWYQMGKRHRIDGPAAEYSDGDKFWCQNGKIHRIDGPAAEYNDGTKEWYIGNERFESKEAFFEALTDKEKEIALFSEDFLNA